MSGTAIEKAVRRYTATSQLTLGTEMREIAEYSHLLGSLISRDVTVRYKRSVLGFVWTMLNPLLLMLIFTAVFSHIFRFDIPNYPAYFLSAYLVWNFFAQATVQAMAAMAWNGPLMKRVRVPKTIFTLATVISGFVNLLLALVPLGLIILITGAPIHAAALVLPVPLAIMAVFTFGVALAVSSMSIYFSDVREMYGVGLAGLMYLTPIFYPMEIVPPRFRWLVEYNPLTLLIGLVRTPLYEGRIPAGSDLMAGSAIAVLSVVIGWTIFRLLARGFFSRL